MENIKSLDGLSFDELYSSFELAFVDYGHRFEKETLRRMLRRRGFDAELSFGAFDQDKLVAFTFNGVGEYDGEKMAYDTGTGTIAAYRGRGLAGKIFQYAVPYLKEAGINHYLLEVLQDNTAAIGVYSKQGFTTNREFNFYSANAASDFLSTAHCTLDIEIRPTQLDIAHMRSLCDFEPAWQNSFASVERAYDNFVILGAYLHQQLIGYCIYEPIAGDFAQLAVANTYRKQGVGTSLVKEAMRFNKSEAIKFVNTETTCQSLADFLHRLPISGKQYEMSLKL